MSRIRARPMDVFGQIAGASLVIACAAVCLDSVGHGVRNLTLGLLVMSWALAWIFALARARWPCEDGATTGATTTRGTLLTRPVSIAAALCATTAVVMRRFLPESDGLCLLAGAAALLLGPGLSLGCVLLDAGTPLRDRLIAAPGLSFGSILTAAAWLAFLGAPLSAASLETTGLALSLVGLAGGRSRARAPSETIYSARAETIE